MQRHRLHASSSSAAVPVFTSVVGATGWPWHGEEGDQGGGGGVSKAAENQSLRVSWMQMKVPLAAAGKCLRAEIRVLLSLHDPRGHGGVSPSLSFPLLYSSSLSFSLLHSPSPSFTLLHSPSVYFPLLPYPSISFPLFLTWTSFDPIPLGKYSAIHHRARARDHNYPATSEGQIRANLSERVNKNE